MKTGIILEGGAMRGMFTCGVIDVLMENDINFDGAIGVSAGAVFGCNLKSRQIGRPIRYNKRFCNNKNYCSLWSWLTTGDLYNAKFCYEDLPEKLDLWDHETFEANPMEFYTVSTDVETGKALYHKMTTGIGEDMLWFRSSASMPLASRPVEIGDLKVLDGGVADSVPIRYFESIGYDRNVVVLTQPLHYRKKKNNLLPLLRIALRKYPNMIKALEDRHIRYNRDIEYIRDKELKGEIFVVRPPEALNIGSMEKNPDELERVYQIGRQTAEQKLEEIKSFLLQSGVSS